MVNQKSRITEEEFSLSDIFKQPNSLIWKADEYSTCKMAIKKIVNLLAFQGIVLDFENKQTQIKKSFIHLSIDITPWILLKKIYHPANTVPQVNNQRLFKN